MSLDDWHTVFVSACLFLALVVSAPLVAAYLPKAQEPFSALALLGQHGMAEDYFPNGSPDIHVGENVRWTIYVHNHMGKTEYISLRIKLLNSTTTPPNSTSCTPSCVPATYEVQRFVQNNETWLYPFSWSVKKATFLGDYEGLDNLVINGEDVRTNVLAKNGCNFRSVIELWIFDEQLNDFRFGWSYGQESRCVWNQVWFNITNTS